jgi:hypothetical protein
VLFSSGEYDGETTAGQAVACDNAAHLMMTHEDPAATLCNRGPYCDRNRNHDRLEVCAGGGGGVSTTGALRFA